MDNPIHPNAVKAMRQLTIVIPAFCEQDRLWLTTTEAIFAARETLDDFEVVIVNDGSTDNTRAVADSLALEYECVSVIHFDVNRGVGAAYKAGLDFARFDNICLVPGDHAFEKNGLLDIFSNVGNADMIISYRTNPRARSPLRRLLSRICTMQLRITTRCWLRDGHSLYVWPVKLARSIKIPNDYSYHLVTLVSLLQRVASYGEIAVTLTPKPDEYSRVLRLGVVLILAWRLSLLTLYSISRIGTPAPRRIKLD